MPTAAHENDTSFDFMGDDQEIDEPEMSPTTPPPPPKRGRGRPPGSTKKTKYAARRAPASQDDDDDDTEEDALTSDGIALPLFQNAVGRNVAYIRVTRLEPNEGTLGNLEDPTASTQEIASRFGGGTFRIQAISTDHKILRSNTIKIAGDPIFQSRTAEALWKRSLGIRDLPNTPTTNPGGLDIKELLLLMSEKESNRLAQDAAVQERISRLQIEADDRRRKDQEEADSRRRRDEEDRERRSALARQQDLERSNAATAQMMAMMQQGHAQTLQFMQQQLAQVSAQAASLASTQPPPNSMMEALKTIAIVKDTFGGSGNSDPDAPEETSMQLLIKHAPAWLNAAGNAIGGAVREIKGNPAPTGNPGLPGNPGGSGSSYGTNYPSDPRVNLLQSLPLPIANKAERLVEKLIEKGRDPERELDRILGALIAETEKLSAPGQTPRVVAPPLVQVERPADIVGPQQKQPEEPLTPVTPIRRNRVVAGPETNGTVSLSFQR